MPELQFDAERHIYTIDRQVVPSVTQILEDVGIVDYSFIPNETREMALERGRLVHLVCQLHDERDLIEESVDPALLPYLNAWRRFLVESGFVIEEIEKRFFNDRWRFAGTRDRRGRLNGMPTVADIKTNSAPAWVRLQLAAYCEFEKFPTTVGRMSVELHKDGTYRAVSIPAKNHAADFNDFCCALRTYNLKREINKERRSKAA